MAGVLITGFEPFGGEAVNPSWEVVKQLDGAMVAGERVVARQLPCVFGEALTALYAALDEHQPVLTIAVGQAGGRVDITVERVAINVDDARIADNKGQQPVDVPVVADGGLINSGDALSTCRRREHRHDGPHVCRDRGVTR